MEDIEKWSLGSTLIDFREFSVETDAVSPNLHLEALEKIMGDLNIYYIFSDAQLLAVIWCTHTADKVAENLPCSNSASGPFFVRYMSTPHFWR
jgi:hypothetical protein